MQSALIVLLLLLSFLCLGVALLGLGIYYRSYRIRKRLAGLTPHCGAHRVPMHWQGRDLVCPRCPKEGRKGAEIILWNKV